LPDRWPLIGYTGGLRRQDLDDPPFDASVCFFGLAFIADEGEKPAR
jgi:hypothetical protein